MNASKISAIMTLLLSFFILPDCVQAYSGGSGDPNNPYQIATAGDLLALAAEVNDYNKCFILTADINLASLDPCTTAIIAPDTVNSNDAFDGTAFTGVFDGSNHTISNLIIDTNGAKNDYLGLFGQIGTGGQIKNLRLENVNITGGDNSNSLGGLVGSNNGSTISNCYSSGDVSGGNISYYLGGLVGVNDGNISNCYSTGTVTSGTSSTHLGGLLGWNSNGTISNCSSSGTVTGGNGSQYLGGLMGWNNSGNISNCYSTDAVSGGTVSYYLGGLVGDNRSVISKCHSTGAVTGTSYLGGLVGASDGNISSCYSTATVTGQNGSWYLGGLAGVNNNSGTIDNCYSTGAVTDVNSSQWLGGLVGYNGAGISKCYSTGTVSGGGGSQHLGGLAGENSGGTISHCYFLSGSGLDNGNGTSLTDPNMKKQSSFVSWDFNDVWRIRENVGYPKLHIASYSGGSGMAGGPYKIATVSDLLAMAANTYDYDAYFVLTADINLGSSGPFTTAVIAPDTDNSVAGFQGVFFTGVFDGNGHTISNLTIDTGGAKNDYLGLFGLVFSGEIKNLGLENVSITGGNNSWAVGGLVGNKVDGDVSRCYSSGAIIGGDNSGDLGGLVGWNNGSSTSDCYSTCTVTGASSSTYLGGLIGQNVSSNIINCRSTGAVTGGDDSEDIGGLIGYSDNGNISNCYSSGKISGGDDSDALGGLVGDNEDSTISDCHSSGNVSGGSNSNNLGGLTGFNYDADINNCYSTGNINGGSGSVALGGLSGCNFGGGGAINDCFATGNVNSDANSQKMGGLAGFNDSSYIYNSYSTGNATSGGGDSCDIGGLVGDNGSGSGNIENCYSTGDANGGGGTSQNIGGLVGNNNGIIGYCYSTGTAGGGVTNVHKLVGYHSVGGGGPDIISNCYFLAGNGPNDPNGTPLTDKQMKQQASFPEWDFVGETAKGTADIWWINEKVSYPKLYWQIDITKCTVTAGAKPNKDKISFSGTMNTTAVDFNDANNVIKVTVYSDDIVNTFDQNFPIDANTFKKGKYNYSKTVGGVKKSFTYDVKTRKFAFAASDVNLLGLDCPVIAKIDIGDYDGIAELDEVIVNGPRVPIPIKLMTGVKNVLRVDKCTVKQNNKPNKDQLTAGGAFAVKNPDPNMANWITDGLVITLGTQHFTIPKEKLKAGKGMFSCSNVKTTDPNATAAATFNFNSCAFTLTIKDANIPDISGDVDFGAAFADFNEVDQVTFP
jgi:hypothetical protein